MREEDSPGEEGKSLGEEDWRELIVWLVDQDGYGVGGGILGESGDWTVITLAFKCTFETLFWCQRLHLLDFGGEGKRRLFL